MAEQQVIEASDGKLAGLEGNVYKANGKLFHVSFEFDDGGLRRVSLTTGSIAVCETSLRELGSACEAPIFQKFTSESELHIWRHISAGNVVSYRAAPDLGCYIEYSPISEPGGL
jgi:hypothetical protein